MKLGFVLYKYFPFGGLQRDFVKIAKACHDRGHHIDVYTLSWQGEIPSFLTVHLAPSFKTFSNHKRYQKFTVWLQQKIKQDQPNGVIGFNKTPDIDIYYAADPCFMEKTLESRQKIYQLTPRFKHFVDYEKAVFKPSSHTEILLISEKQKPFFIKHYHTPINRFHLLPPGIGKDRIAPANKAEIRTQFRNTLNIKADELFIVLIGSGFKTKGVDRALYAVASLPIDIRQKIKLNIIGQDNPRPFQSLAQKLQIENQVEFLQGRDDIPHFLFSADLLLHPAYAENTGTVILEAIVAGLPVLVSDVCGYAHFVNDAQAGLVIPSPFQQTELNLLLLKMLTSPNRSIWSENGIAFAKTADIYTMPERAAHLIENLTQKIVRH